MGRHKFKKNEDMSKRIALTRGMEAIINSKDFDFLNQWKWHAHKGSRSEDFYAARSVWPTRELLLMHRILLPSKKWVDHKNGNTLDNRRKNLRCCTPSQNVWNSKKAKNNTSGFKGVTFHKARNAWQAQICFKTGRRYLGIFKTPQEAHRAYKKAAKQLFKEFAKYG
jgi:hypothetical protein